MIGKIIGAILGYLFLHNILGVAVGALLGHVLIDARIRRNNIPHAQIAQIQEVFFNTVFMLLGYVAKADGHISEVEIKLAQAYMEKMELTAEHKREAIRLFKLGAAADFNSQQQLKVFMAAAQRSPNLRQMLLVYLINMAMADGHLDNNEARVLREVAETLGFSRIAFEQLLHMIGAQNSFSNQHQTRASDLELAYQALGANKSMSDKEIKTVYRRLMSQYHPDKLMGQGLPDDMVKAATERSQEIQAAYDVIKKARA